MMAVCGLSQMKNYTSVETLEITQNLINSSRQCPSGHGLMVVLRIPCIPLAAVAYERLYNVRERLALEDNFEIILGNPNSGITIGKHFVEQLKVNCRMACAGKLHWMGRWGDFAADSIVMSWSLKVKTKTAMRSMTFTFYTYCL